MESSAPSLSPTPATEPEPAGAAPSQTHPLHHHQQRRLTVTQLEQMKVEEKVAEIFRLLSGVAPHTQTLMLEIWRDQHIEYLTRGLKYLGPSYHVLDANRPWICYWIVHSIALLGDCLDCELEDGIVDFLSRCEDKDGGYAGGPGQMPHLATTYAAVNSLITLGSDTALSSIKRDQLYKFLLRMKDSSGAFRMHDRGEIDVRACYTAISVASILNILDSELIRDVGKYILSCQTYEGGIAGEPGSEAHGGYTFCGLATMIITNEADKLDLPSLIDWVASRQGVECGFQGRTNKLVDGCYSFWQGAVLALVQRLPILNKELESNKQLESLSIQEVQLSEDDECSTRSSNLVGEGTDIDENVHGIETSHYESECTTQRSSLVGEGTYPDENLHGVWTSQYELKGDASSVGFTFIRRKNGHGPLFHSIALQQYVLLCSQALEGGFKDKPGKHPDFYHTCYCLSGLSSSQYSWSNDSVAPLPQAILGPYSNLLEPIHPLYNVVLERYYKAHEYFSRETSPIL